jgi:hypothetical protein
LRVAALGAACLWYALAASPRPEVPPEAARAPEAPPVHADPAAWQVLAPRHRGVSPAPLAVLLTPGWLGAVEVRVETPRGVHAAVTAARSLPWPAALPPLRIGEWCSVTIRGPHGGAAEATFLRVRSPAPGRSDPDWLGLGLPAAACLRGGPEGRAACLRAGVCGVPEWGPSANMPRARESE